MKVSYAQLTDLTGMAYRTIRKRFEAANIKPIGVAEGPGGANLWDSSEALRAIYSPDVGGSEKLDGQQEKALLDKARREAQELKNEEARRNLAPCEVTGKIIADIAINVRTKALGIPSKIASVVPADIRVDVVKETEKLIREILSDLSAYVPEVSRG